MSLLIFAHPVSIVFGKLEQKRKEKHIFCLDKNKYLVFMSSFNLFLLGLIFLIFNLFSELNLLNEVCLYPLAT